MSALARNLWSVLRQVSTLHVWNVDFCTCCEGEVDCTGAPRTDASS